MGAATSADSLNRSSRRCELSHSFLWSVNTRSQCTWQPRQPHLRKGLYVCTGPAHLATHPTDAPWQLGWGVLLPQPACSGRRGDPCWHRGYSWVGGKVGCRYSCGEKAAPCCCRYLSRRGSFCHYHSQGGWAHCLGAGSAEPCKALCTRAPDCLNLALS